MTSLFFSEPLVTGDSYDNLGSIAIDIYNPSLPSGTFRGILHQTHTTQ